MKKIIRWMMSLALILSLFFIGSSNVEAATTPELSKSNLTLVKGNSATIKILDATVDEKESAEWESSNAKVVAVSQKGRIRAKAVGESIVTVTVAGKKLLCRVNVESITTNYSNKVVSLVNEERSQRGLKKLKTDAMLTKAAQARAEEIADKAEFSHTRANGESYMSIFEEYSVKYYGASENLAKGLDTPASAMAAWMEDSGKRASILTSEYTHVGVGYCNGYWVQLFVMK